MGKTRQITSHVKSMHGTDAVTVIEGFFLRGGHGKLRAELTNETEKLLVRSRRRKNDCPPFSKSIGNVGENF